MAGFWADARGFCVHRRLRPLQTQFSSSTAPARCAIKRGAICNSRAGIALFEVCFGRRSRDPLVHGTPQVSKSGTRSSIGLVQLCFSEPRRHSFDSKKGTKNPSGALCVHYFSDRVLDTFLLRTRCEIYTQIALESQPAGVGYVLRMRYHLKASLKSGIAAEILDSQNSFLVLQKSSWEQVGCGQRAQVARLRAARPHDIYEM